MQLIGHDLPRDLAVLAEEDLADVEETDVGAVVEFGEQGVGAG